MDLTFYKYQGTGNDFVMIDNRKQIFDPHNTELVKRLCNRRFGIGADGLILLQNREGYDFEMIYFNADGNESTMCGNGGRCIVAFAHFLNIIKDKGYFLAIDGPHDAQISNKDWVELKMSDVKHVINEDEHYEMDTGSPHYVTFVEDVDDINVVENGQAIRYSKKYREKGINVNFVEKTNQGIKVLTYERGVEDETLSCGTGVTAAALSYYLESPNKQLVRVPISSKGGELEVRFEAEEEGGFKNIWLCGPAVQVFTGTLSVS